MAMGRPSEGEKPPEVTPDDRATSYLCLGDVSPLARRRLAVERQADPLPRHALDQLPLDAAAPGKPPSARRRFEIDQARAASIGLVVGVDVMTIKAQARFEPQRIAGAQAEWPGPRPGTAGRRRTRRPSTRSRNLVAVLAGIARAGDEQGDAAPVEHPPGHKGHRGCAGDLALQGVRRARPLEGEQRAVVQDLQPQIGQAGREMLEIRGLAGGVDHQGQAFALRPGRKSRDHQVVEDPAVLVGELGVADAAFSQGADIAGNQAFEAARRVGAGQDRLPHVRDIEQAGLLAGEQMLGDDAAAVIDRQLIASERNHAAAQRQMALMERRAGGFGIFVRSVGIFVRSHAVSRQGNSPPEKPAPRICPLCPET